jgi:lactoylglutathione lyase
MPSITRTPTLAPTVPYNRASRWHLMSADRRQPTGTTVSSDPCPTVAQIELIALATDDVESLRDFYLQLGGVASSPSTDPDTGLRSCVLDFCGVRLEVFEQPGSGERAADVGRSPGLLHLGFALESADAVDDLTGVIAAAGHRVLEPPHRAGELGRYESVVLDPDGNRVKLTI